MVLGLLWLLCRRQWRSMIWLGFPTVLLFVVGSTPLVERLVAAAERPWVGGLEDGGRRTEEDISAIGSRKSKMTLNPQPSTLSLQPADAVVALGGVHRVSRHDTLGFAVGDGGSRLLTAIELVRSGKAKTLVLGGSWPLPGKPGVASMSVVEDWVVSWGVAGGVVTNLGICINTHDEAVAFRKLAQSQGWSNVMLVTSALHMRRSLALFRKQGVEVTPVAADFHVQGVSQDFPFSPFPRQGRLFLLTLYMHEKIGWWVYRARGWV